MYLQIVVLICLINFLNVSAKENDKSDGKKSSDSRTIYDQRQTGKYNVHVNIKDVQFFSLSDSISSLGDYGSYDYGEYGQVDGDGDYDISHLTVNPIFAFLGTNSKPTKPSTTTFSTTEKADSNGSSSTIKSQELSSSSSKETTTIKQEIETTVKQENISNSLLSSKTEKPALRPLKVNESIDYEEIPVEVQYYRANQPKLPLAYASLLQNRHAINLKRHRQPSVVQILDGRRNNNVKIIESDDDQERTVKICGRGEFRDNHGRCRIKANGRNRVPGLRRVFNALSSILPKSK